MSPDVFYVPPIKKELFSENEADLLEYMQVFAQHVSVELQTESDKGRIQYYRGMLYSIKCLSQVYETLLKGDFQ